MANRKRVRDLRNRKRKPAGRGKARTKPVLPRLRHCQHRIDDSGPVSSIPPLEWDEREAVTSDYERMYAD
jgi:hypothetical protein